MKVIKNLSDMMWDELEGAEHYIKCALKYQEERPGLSKVLYEISVDEMGHVTTLHNEVVKIIETYRKEHGEPPEAMQAVYDYIHEKLIDKANGIKIYQDQYRNY